MKELFDFVTDATITEDNIDLYLEKAMTLSSQRTTEDITDQQKIDEEVRKIHTELSNRCDHLIMRFVKIKVSSSNAHDFYCLGFQALLHPSKSG